MKKFDMKLPVGVLAFIVLNATNISAESENLTKATVGELKYDSMKNKNLQIFNGATSEAEATLDDKVESNNTSCGLHNAST